MAFEIKRGDLEPPLNAQLIQADSTPINLSTAVSVRALVRHTTTQVLAVNRVVTIVDAVTGKVRILWATGETAIDGPYEVEFEVMWPGGRPQTVPSNGFFNFLIYPDLGGA